MAQDDWAIVVGIRVYPSLSDLEGPESDARSFVAWLLDPTGGDVPSAHVTPIISSDFRAAQGEPDERPIRRAFDRLLREADQRRRRGEGFRVGRRLYLYFSGHGFAPRPKHAALLTADATFMSPGYHIVGRSYAEWFHRSGFFEEVVLLMDCCQENYRQVDMRPVPYADVDPGGIEKRKIFIGHGATFGRAAREKPINGVVRGVFTATLLEGLCGAQGAWDSPPGTVTDRSLSDYLFKRMKELLSPEELADSDISPDPEIEFDPNPNKRIVFVSRPAAAPVAPMALNAVAAFSAAARAGSEALPATFDVRIHLRSGDIGKRVRLESGRLEVVREETAQASPWIVPLSEGLYLLSFPAEGRELPFTVRETQGSIDVQT